MVLRMRVGEDYVMGGDRHSRGRPILDKISKSFAEGVVGFEDISPRDSLGHKVGGDRYFRSYKADLRDDSGNDISLSVHWTDVKGPGGYVPRNVGATLTYWSGTPEVSLVELRDVLGKVGFSKK